MWRGGQKVFKLGHSSNIVQSRSQCGWTIIVHTCEAYLVVLLLAERVLMRPHAIQWTGVSVRQFEVIKASHLIPPFRHITFNGQQPSIAYQSSIIVSACINRFIHQLSHVNLACLYYLFFSLSSLFSLIHSIDRRLQLSRLFALLYSSSSGHTNLDNRLNNCNRQIYI